MSQTSCHSPETISADLAAAYDAGELCPPDDPAAELDADEEYGRWSDRLAGLPDQYDHAETYPADDQNIPL